MTQATERMTQFAEHNRLRLRDTGAEKVVPGKYGEIADMGDEGLLRLRLLAVPRSENKNRALRSRRAFALASLELEWSGDAESSFYFDPGNEAHVSLAVKLVGAKRKRTMSEDQRQVLSARLATFRKLPRAA
jgi:hypothetical protein